MRIALCMIVKDDSELESLKMAVGSASEYVDEVHITANHKPSSKIEAWCSEKDYDYSFLPWKKDFGEQRNFNFNRVSDDVDYILWLDYDDILVGGEYLRRVAKLASKKENQVVFFTYWYACLFDGDPSPETLLEVETHHPRERLIKPGSITWKKRIHETPVEHEGAAHSYSRIHHLPEEPDKVFPIAVLHTGAERYLNNEAIRQRNLRNMEILELELEDERKTDKGADPRTILYLMKVYATLEDRDLWAQCVDLGREYLSLSGWDEERAQCYQFMAQCLSQLGEYSMANSMLHRATQEWPHDPMLYLLLADSYFNLGRFDRMKHWMDHGLTMDSSSSKAAMNNPYQMKVLSAELATKYYLYGPEKDPRKAYQASLLLYNENPTDNNHKNATQLYDLKELDIACEHVDKLSSYLESIGEEKAVLGLLQAVPQAIKSKPFAWRLWNKHSKPRVWGEKEICYYANFGGKHFEEWSPKNIESGIGGSETAVINLSKEWTKLGYKVTVYGDPGPMEGDHDGVVYLPWYAFNMRDDFNVFIQWRSGSLAKKIRSKRFLVDLHDVWSEVDYAGNLDAIDAFLVKSNYHRELAPSIPDDKFVTISNGIAL